MTLSTPIIFLCYRLESNSLLVSLCLYSQLVKLLMHRGLCPGRLWLWRVPPASQRLLGCLAGHTPSASSTLPPDRCPYQGEVTQVVKLLGTTVIGHDLIYSFYVVPGWSGGSGDDGYKPGSQKMILPLSSSTLKAGSHRESSSGCPTVSNLGPPRMGSWVATLVRFALRTLMATPALCFLSCTSWQPLLFASSPAPHDNPCSLLPLLHLMATPALCFLSCTS